MWDPPRGDLGVHNTLLLLSVSHLADLSTAGMFY